jgi:hypothetical protein
MAFGATRSILVGAGLLGALACADMAWAQFQPLGDAVSPTTAEERLAAERAALSDPRVTAIAGRGELRVASSDVVVDKGEAERFIEGISVHPPTRQVIVAVLNIQRA